MSRVTLKLPAKLIKILKNIRLQVGNQILNQFVPVERAAAKILSRIFFFMSKYICLSLKRNCCLANDNITYSVQIMIFY